MSRVSLSKLTQTGFLDANGNVSRPWLNFLRALETNNNSPENSWPVGSIFITTSASAPADLLGFGTWTVFGSGRVLVGQDSGDTDFDVLEETGGAKSVTPAGTISTPIFTGDALATHSHGAGTLVPSAHNGSAVADHSSHTHSFTQSSNAGSPDLVAVDTTASGVAASGTTGNESATLTHNVTQPDNHTMSGSTQAVSAGTPSGTISQPSFTGGAISVQQKYIVVKMWKRTA